PEGAFRQHGECSLLCASDQHGKTQDQAHWRTSVHHGSLDSSVSDRADGAGRGRVVRRQDLMQHCPRWESCSAPVCPADPLWRQVPHLRGDRVCAYLTERAKPGGEARLRSILSSGLAEKVSEAYRELSTADCHDGMHVERGRGYIRAVLSSE